MLKKPKKKPGGGGRRQKPKPQQEQRRGQQDDSDDEQDVLNEDEINAAARPRSHSFQKPPKPEATPAEEEEGPIVPLARC